jgi:hypothetical protein
VLKTLVFPFAKIMKNLLSIKITNFEKHPNNKTMKIFYLTTALAMLMGEMAFSQSDSAEFTSSGTFIVPAGITSITVEVVGAGARGGYNGGGGGGGGGYAKGVYTVTPLTSIPVTIGVPNINSTPDTTKLGNLIKATSGIAGIYVANPNLGGGGAGGIGIGGTIANNTGGAGGGGYYTYFGGGGGGAAGVVSNGGVGGNTITWTGVCLTPGGTGGLAGGAPGGAGGKGAGFTDGACNVTNPSGNGLNYGGGGGGANGNGGGPGNGIGGYCKIKWGITTNIDQITNNNYLAVYPNPSTGKFVIDSREKIHSVEIYNLIGKRVYYSSAIKESPQNEIDLSAYPKGLYFLSISDGENCLSEKVLLQ